MGRRPAVVIRRPVLSVVVNLIILIAGLQAMRSLTVRQYPRNENATITVTTIHAATGAAVCHDHPLAERIAPAS